MASPQNIDKNNVESISNLTSLQEGMLFHYTKNSEKDSYLIRLFLNVKGDFSYNVFCETWNKLSLQNEVLRTIFRWEGLKTPVQIVLKQKQLPCEYIDVSHQEIAFEDAKEYISEFHSNNDINLTDNPFYLSVYKINRNEFTIEIKYHHILYDGWSNGIILSEFFEVYHSILNNKPVTFKPKVRFNEYIKEINKVQKKDINSFWQNHLLDYSLIPAFSDKIEESAELPIFCDINYSLSNDLNAKINDYSAKNHVSVASILYTSWGILLQKITNSNDVLFGTTISGRNVQIKHIENTVGLFINTIPLRIINLGNDTIQNTINNVNKHLIDREIYTNCSLAELKRISSVGQNEDLFNSLVIIENYPINFDEIKKMEQFEVKSYEMAEHTHYDLTLTIKLFDKPELIINYNNALYSKNLIVKLQSQLVRILETIVNKPTIEIVDIKLITSDEKNKISNQFNNTYLEYDRHLTIDQAFERQAQLNLDKEIITCNNKSITYKEFLQQSNSLANNLIDNSIVPGNLVGIMMGRSSEMLVAILSVLKAGATYVPIDPKFPDDRITHMIEDSKLKLIITDNQNRAKVEQLQGYFGIIDFAEIDNSRTEFCAKIQKSKKATDAAYVIYTSGSTGKPKGVVISHSNVLNFIEGITSSIQFNQNDKILAVTTVSFDIFVLETLLPLIKGTKIVIATDEETVEPELLCNLIKKHNIGLLQFTPSRLKLLLSYDEFLHSFTNVKILMLGGEALPENLFSELKQKFNGLIYNLYGPTETTVWSTLKELTNEQKVTIGKPIANTKIFILGGNNEIQPIGFSGELCIGGEGVGLGYFNNEALTNEKFIIDKNLDANPIYRTGDIAKWLEDGNIYFFGRKDNQVKIRGYRIETGDIESILSEYKGISDCVVIAINDNNDTAYLCAYYVSDEQISTNSLAEYLLDKLPEYMIPSYFMAIDKVPLTPNGKINRKALPSPQLISVNDYVAPTNNTEHLLVSIWSEILGIDKNAVSIHADFFKLGGHSLKVTKLISQIYKHANCKLSVSNVFNNATVYKIASLINNSKKEKLSTVSKAEIKTKYPLSNSQKRLFVLQQLDRDATFYNMPGLFKVNKKIDRKKLEETLTLLVKRHESLRSNIILDEGKPLLMINDSNKLIIETYTAPPLQEYQMVEKVDEIFSEFIKPFELEKNLLFRAGIIETEGEILYVMIDMHHIISDGTSVDLLYKEFIDLYQQKELSKLTYQYQDYVKWIGDRKNNETYLKQKKYWLNIFQQDISPLQLPTDFERPSIQSFKGDSCEIKISDELYNGLIKLSENLKISPFVCLLGCINILLSKLSNSDDIAVGFTQAGREKEEWQNIVGMFVNTLPLRNYLSNDSTFETFISKVKDNFLKALENQEVRLEDIIENININRDPSRNPIFDVLINYQETEMVNTDGSQVLIEKVYQLRKISKFDLTFDCLKRNDSIEIRLEYATSLFAVETIKRIANSLSNIFKCIADNPSIQLSNINILGKEEINTLLNKFNSTNFLFNRNLAITQIFESQVNKYAINIALSYKNNILTYSELDSKSNQFAHFLKDKDIKRGDVIGVIGERSIELIITIFGILKAGAVYLPLDKAFPVKRVNYILDNCKAKLIISPIDNVIINNVSVETIFYDQSKYNTYNNKQVNEKCEDNDLAYIIYTSGSTGTPKGVMVEHRQAVNLLYSLNKMYPLYNEDSFLLKTPCVFDVSISELFGWFMNGGKLSILPSEKEKDAYEIIHSIHENKITHINFVPSLFNVFVDILEPKDYEKLISLKYIFLAGEAINPNAIQKFNQIPHSISLENIYGPTEATVYSTNYSLNSWGKKSEIPIGKPLYNTQAYIINANNQLCGIGIIGELCLSGANLARGYFNNEEITKEKFIDHPFINGCKMYKTGDLAKWLPDGNIEFKGRIDDQVKIRGYRIELGEIENVINKINK
ncbi:MAG: amino acid adenylation domain-containing protein, partial [bacterium]|nr:amino acid adenylation domain-containing protein [bacterium]